MRGINITSEDCGQAFMVWTIGSGEVGALPAKQPSGAVAVTGGQTDCQDKISRVDSLLAAKNITRSCWVSPTQPLSAIDGRQMLGRFFGAGFASMIAASRATRSVTHTIEHFASTIANLGEVPVIELTDGGRVVAVLMSPNRFEELLDAGEETEDYRALAEHAADPDPDLVPWDDVKRDLGMPKTSPENSSTP